jgi:hypothetical protein
VSNSDTQTIKVLITPESDSAHNVESLLIDLTVKLLISFYYMILPTLNPLSIIIIRVADTAHDSQTFSELSKCLVIETTAGNIELVTG